MMLSQENFNDLKEKGYTVVGNVLTEEECDQTIAKYREWLSNFKEGEWPYSSYSLIQRYNTGNMEPTWFVRLKSKKVFAEIWKTDKLLSSVDAIAIGRPPEDGEELFHRPGDHWLHLDQSAEREGLHAYQGAVYLETADEDDWTLHVMESSHLHFEEFIKSNEKVAIKSMMNGFYSLRDEQVKHFSQLGCTLRRVPVPKGGMVLWDSRLVHANAGVVKGRKNPGRWRFCVFVSMTPAIWANEEDLKVKREAYNEVRMTTHWSSQGVGMFKTHIPSYSPQDVEYPREHSDISKTDEAKRLCGVLPYDFNDGQPNCDFFPEWNELSPRGSGRRKRRYMRVGLIILAGIASAVSLVIMRRIVRSN
ncbi:hypothetical protein ACF0H5_019296 [Mactra antiquata]